MLLRHTVHRLELGHVTEVYALFLRRTTVRELTIISSSELANNRLNDDGVPCGNARGLCSDVPTERPN